jgi:hypothetical protein
MEFQSIDTDKEDEFSYLGTNSDYEDDLRFKNNNLENLDQSRKQPIDDSSISLRILEGAQKYLENYVSNIHCRDRLYELEKSWSSSNWEGELNGVMRTVLLDWMIEVSTELRLKRDTYYLSVSLIDQYVCRAPCLKQELQLIGITSLLIAIKWQEIFIPHISLLETAADNAFTESQIRRMEVKMLTRFQWRVMHPTPIAWLDWLVLEWDSFISNLSNTACPRNRVPLLLFDNSDSCIRYCDAVHLLDLAWMDREIYTHPRYLVAASVLYLILNKYLYTLNYECIYGHKKDNSDRNSTVIVAAAEVTHELMSLFFCKSLEIKTIQEMMPIIQLIHPLQRLPLEFEDIDSDDLHGAFTLKRVTQSHHSLALDFILQSYSTRA